jgi:hypothetical protein
MTSLARILPGREPWEDEDEAEDYVDDPLPRWVRKLGHQVEPRLQECKPTRAEPGSAEKIAILEARFAAGQALWNEDDPTVGLASVNTGIEQALSLFQKTWRGVEHRHSKSHRANPWSGEFSKHVHLGYFDTPEGAVEATRLWRIGIEKVNRRRKLLWLWARFEARGNTKGQDLLSVKQSAKLLGITLLGFDDLRRAGLVRPVKPGLFDRDALLDLIDEAHHASRELPSEEVGEPEACLILGIVPNDLRALAEVGIIGQPYRRSELLSMAQNASKILDKLTVAMRSRPTMTVTEIGNTFKGLTGHKLGKLVEVGLLMEPFQRADICWLVRNAGRIAVRMRTLIKEEVDGKV